MRMRMGGTSVSSGIRYSWMVLSMDGKVKEGSMIERPFMRTG